MNFPEIVILRGEIIYSNHFLLSRVKKQTLNILTDGLEIRLTSLGGDFEVIGAAAVLLHDIFNFLLSA